MKIRSLILAVGLYCCLSCQQSHLPSLKETQMRMIDEFKVLLSGTWQIQQAQIQRNELIDINYPTGIFKDTVLQNLATLQMQPATQQSDDRILTLEGTLLFQNQLLPVQLKFYPHPSKDAPSQGVVYISLGVTALNTPLLKTAISYLTAIGLLDENFSITTAHPQPTMTWQGLNRAMVEAKLQKM
jgi:hypothetical protein